MKIYLKRKNFFGFFSNKKAVHEPASTLTWVVATFFIIILLFIFLLYVLVKGGIVNTGLFGTSTTNRGAVEQGSENDFVLLQTFYNFLDSYIDFNDEKIQVKDLIAGTPENDKEKYKMFKEAANEFVKTDIVQERLSKPYTDVWIRVYDFNEEASLSGSTKLGYRGYEIYIFEEHPCDPQDTKSSVFYYVIPPNSQDSNGKKIVFCLGHASIT